MCALYSRLAEICVLTESLALIVGRSEKFTDKYVNTSINVHVFVWKGFMHLTSPGKLSTRTIYFFIYAESNKGQKVLPIMFCSHQNFTSTICNQVCQTDQSYH